MITTQGFIGLDLVRGALETERRMNQVYEGWRADGHPMSRPDLYEQRTDDVRNAWGHVVRQEDFRPDDPERLPDFIAKMTPARPFIFKMLNEDDVG